MDGALSKVLIIIYNANSDAEWNKNYSEEFTEHFYIYNFDHCLKAYWQFYSLSNLGNETECLTGLNFQYSLANINERFICISDA